MRPMSIDELYVKLSSPNFKNPANDLSYNYYVFLYDPQDEYRIREEIRQFKASFVRPSNSIDILTLNLFDEFCEFLKNQPFGKLNPSYLNYVFEKEPSRPDNFIKALSIKAQSHEFMEYVHNKIMSHISIEDELSRPYVFVNGIGSIYPYLRASNFLTAYEEFNKSNKYKIILFYPGSQAGNSYRLFNKLDDQHTYRVTFLLNE